jgi:MoaA/NifB/PqqE/SkfB family radical SAM enzyme
MDTEEWLLFFEELSDCAVLDVSIGGGEPFIRDDIEEIIRGITANRMRYSILSNGTAISNKEAKFIAST